MKIITPLRRFLNNCFCLSNRNIKYAFLISVIYYIICFFILFLIPFNTAFIFILILPVIYINIGFKFIYGILSNFFFLFVLYLFLVTVKNNPGYKLDISYNQSTIYFMVFGTIFSFIIVFLINYFTSQYQQQQHELSLSMQELATSYRNLEITQTKLMSLTRITKDLLSFQNEEKLISHIVNLLQKYMLYENIVYCKWKKKEWKIEEKIGFSKINPDQLMDKLDVKYENFRDQEIEIYKKIINQQEYKIIYVPIFYGEQLDGVLMIINQSKKIKQEDKYIMEVLADHVSLIIDNIKLLENTREMALTDGGTNLYNQRFFYDKLREVYKISRENDYSFSIIIFDIDNFKIINDKYGHLFGDKVLEKIAGLMEKSVRSHDVLARYGGDEFALILPMTDKEISNKISQRIVKNINKHVFIAEDGAKIKASISGGLASFPEYRVNDPIELVKRADQALYESKKQGKNRIIAEDEL